MGFTKDFNKPASGNAIDADLDQMRDNWHYLAAVAAHGSLVLPGWQTTVQGDDKSQPDSITLTRGTKKIIIYYTWTGDTVSTIQFCYDNGVGETSPSVTCYPAISFYFDDTGNPLGTVDPQDVLTSLVSYWTFNEAGTESPLVHADSHGSYDMSQTATSGETGKLGNCIRISGAAKVATAAAGQADWKLDADFTVAGWIKTNGVSGTDCIVANYYNFNGSGWALRCIDSGGAQITALVETDSGPETFATSSSPAPITTGAWYWICMTWEASAKRVTVYLNDQQVIQGTVSGTIATYSNEELTFGQQGYTAGANNWNGWLDEFGFWSTVLDGNKRSYLYNSGTGRSYADF